MLGSPTKLLDRGSSLVSLSESLSLGSVNHPLRLAVFVCSWVLRPKMEQGFGLVELVLRLRGFQRKTSQSFKVVFRSSPWVLVEVLVTGLFGVREKLVDCSCTKFN